MSEAPAPLRLVPLMGMPEIEPGADLAGLLRRAADEAGVELANRVVVVCQKVVSKAEGRLVDLADVEPRELARLALGIPRALVERVHPHL